MSIDNTTIYGNLNNANEPTPSIEEIEHHLRIQVENAYRNGYVDGFHAAADEVARQADLMRINQTDVKVHAHLHYDPQLVASVPDLQIGKC